jgi:septal ring factor EnvC (AmiA/AmiB activator)
VRPAPAFVYISNPPPLVSIFLSEILLPSTAIATFKMARFMPKLATTLHIDEVSKEQILQSIQSNDAARVDLLQKLDEKKRLDKELSQKLESNVKAMKDLEKKIRDLEQSRHQLCSDLSPKERTINL